MSTGNVHKHGVWPGDESREISPRSPAGDYDRSQLSWEDRRGSEGSGAGTPVDTASFIFNAWDTLLQETELDAQAHVDVASLLIKNVYSPLREVAAHKNRQADMLTCFRENFEAVLNETARQTGKAENDYHGSYQEFAKLPDKASEESTASSESIRGNLHNFHNDYILRIRATNRTVDEYNKALPQILEQTALTRPDPSMVHYKEVNEDQMDRQGHQRGSAKENTTESSQR
ncbi:uncharacterized protein LOC101864668 [Aplysia californica]|uniref:Uncharacterized protein LOC101864668 n=1 Tax=Aplysia californica TaxID=6500 RepID=A0ABM1AB83_APLCA|nr:uncharacterized protein LOC101864668 [Aplysia californica]